MTPTTIAALRSSFVNAIQQVTPSKRSGYKWTYARAPNNVPGSPMRQFFVSADPPTAEDEDVSVFGGGLSYSTSFYVTASYARVPIDVYDDVVEHDAHDLWAALRGVADDGLIDVGFPAWELEEDPEESFRVGVFEFTVRYFGQGS